MARWIIRAEGQPDLHVGNWPEGRRTAMETETKTRRVAIVTGGADSLEQVQRYMPGNYEARAYTVSATPQTYLNNVRTGPATVVVIVGTDVAGWTMDDYVLPRLASGLIFAVEIEESF